MPLQPLTVADLQLLRRRFEEIRSADMITSKRISDLITEWEPRVQPDGVFQASAA